MIYRELRDGHWIIGIIKIFFCWGKQYFNGRPQILPLGDPEDFVRAKGLKRLAVVLTRSEITRLLRHMGGKQKLMTSLLYGVCFLH